MLKTLFLNPPSFENFDGGSGSRYQAIREVRSFWYPTWLAYPAGMLKGSRLLDAPADGIGVEQTLDIAKEYDFVVFYTSTPSLGNDIALAEQIKVRRSKTKISFVGPHPTVLPEQTLRASRAIDFVCIREFDYSTVEFAQGKPMNEIAGIAYLKEDGTFVRTTERSPIRDLDELPFAVDVYKRDLKMRSYDIPWMKWPYVSYYTGRGCSSRCTFCLWPQTFSGNSYRTRTPDNVLEEARRCIRYFPEMKEMFFDDDTFTENRPRAREIARKLKSLGISWGSNTKVSVDYETLKILRDSGYSVCLVGFESGNQQILHNIRKGASVRQAYEFARNCHRLGIRFHGTFIVGLPGETKETIEQSIKFACDLHPDSIQVSIASPYPGTRFYDYVTDNGYYRPGAHVSEKGYQLPRIEYPGLSARTIFKGMERFQQKFYFRPRYIAREIRKMVHDGAYARRRLHEGWEYALFMANHKLAGSAAHGC